MNKRNVLFEIVGIKEEDATQVIKIPRGTHIFNCACLMEPNVWAFSDREVHEIDIITETVEIEYAEIRTTKRRFRIGGIGVCKKCKNVYMYTEKEDE